MRRTTVFSVLACLVLVCFVVTASEIPERPEKLDFPELSFDVPDGTSMRYELASGTPVYAKEDHQFPLISLSVYFKGGEYIEPAGKEGLVAIASEAWRTGGAGDRSPQELDEELDFLAANLSTSIGDVTGSVSLSFLAKDLDTILPILMDVLTSPRFEEDRFAKAKDDLIQSMKTRNDNTASIEAREWKRLIFGDDYWSNRIATKASVDAVTADDCKAFIDRMVRSDNVVVAAAGDFDIETLIKSLNGSIGALAKLEAPMPEVPQPAHSPEPGVYMVDKPDVNQGRVRLGHIGYREGHPQQFALMVANDILGGGGFTSRITKRVRSDEGLAYSAYSSIRFPISTPGTFAGAFQSKSSTCAFAAEITFGLIREMQAEQVSEDELATSKASFVETFPRRFESASRTVGLFASGELLGRDPGYWNTYRDKITALESAQLMAAAKQNLHPDKMIILVVGNTEEILKGHPDHEASFEDFGTMHHLPLRDPMTLEPISD